MMFVVTCKKLCSRSKGVEELKCTPIFVAGVGVGVHSFFSGVWPSLAGTIWRVNRWTIERNELKIKIRMWVRLMEIFATSNFNFFQKLKKLDLKKSVTNSVVYLTFKIKKVPQIFKIKKLA